MRSVRGAELERLNAEIVGYLLAQRSPPRELIAERDRLRGDRRESEPEAPRNPLQALRRRALFARG